MGCNAFYVDDYALKGTETNQVHPGVVSTIAALSAAFFSVKKITWSFRVKRGDQSVKLLMRIKGNELTRIPK